jgi:ketosteroid isomerase-like protein
MDERALDVVIRFNDAWGAHDLDATLALVTEDCVFDATGPAPDGTRCAGKDAIRAAWEPIFADAAAVFTTEEIFAAGDRVVSRWHYSWGTGHIRGADLFRVRDGLVAEKLSYVKG